ncbi:hypothetical protein Bsph_4618 [Lysinibacillus sphaericus C3-41]|uniref:Uncharacterized protein n=1 Tax=Lysinibacillus sphaericus (strain C3-41) TaxID=444177 RepID=B1HMY4_LYSSC|nr:hypothetical protein Bsph_4618 [Lysinibacillus sphaericus C3-41]
MATLIAVGLIGTYSFVPPGFGAIFQDIVATQVSEAGMVVSSRDVPVPMAIPVLGMLIGLLQPLLYIASQDIIKIMK